MDVREKLVELIVEASHQCDDFYDLWDMRQCAEEIASFMIAHGVTVQEWISVKDRLPDADGDYLVWNDYHKAIVGHYWSKGRYFISKAVTVTHWMPLPQPPKGE